MGIESLKEEHKPLLEKFCCSKKDETEFLYKDALTHQGLLVNKTYLLFNRKNKSKILSYIAVGVGSVVLSGERVFRGKQIKDKRLPRHIPCMLVCRLATANDEEGKDYATYLLAYAIRLGLEKSKETPFPIIALHAYPDTVKFYEDRGFEKAEHQKKANRPALWMSLIDEPPLTTPTTSAFLKLKNFLKIPRF